VIPHSRGGREALRRVLDGGSAYVTPPRGESNRAVSDAAPLLGGVLRVRTCPDPSWRQRAAVRLASPSVPDQMCPVLQAADQLSRAGLVLEMLLAAPAWWRADGSNSTATPVAVTLT